MKPEARVRMQLLSTNGPSISCGTFPVLTTGFDSCFCDSHSLRHLVIVNSDYVYKFNEWFL